MKKNIYANIRKIGRLLFSVEQKRRILKVTKIFRIKQSESIKLVKVLKNNLLERGFTEKALHDLNLVLNYKGKPQAKRLAAWEMARWYANYRNEEGAYRCLYYLKIALEGADNIDEERQAAVMQAECYEVLGDIESARKVVMNTLAQNPHPDLYLAAANLETEIPKRINWINKALEFKGIKRILISPSDKLLPYDWITAEVDPSVKTEDVPKVSIIIPAYNSAEIIHTALNSILVQTWGNIEILVVDDCSSDGTPKVIEEYVAKDSRVKLLSTPVNSGPYVARNIALLEATGDFITTNDADDWSHPQKIEIQVKHLLQNPKVIANLSEQVRATSELKFYRRGNYGNLIFSNMSSFMFRRKKVMDALGFWDCVRFGADNELIHRVKRVFGQESVVQLNTGPLSFQRQSETSLTGNSYFGYHGYYMGARKEYYQSHKYYQKKAESYFYNFPMLTRPFPVPEPMWPDRKVLSEERREFDVVLISDFRYCETTSDMNIKEIQLHKNKGLRIGLVQMYQYDYNAKKDISYQVRDLIDGERVQMLVYGERIACKQLIVLDPAAVQERQRHIPDISPGKVLVLIEQLPFIRKEGEVRYSYEPSKCDSLIEEYFGQKGVWCPINPKVFKEFKEYARELGQDIILSEINRLNPEKDL